MGTILLISGLLFWTSVQEKIRMSYSDKIIKMYITGSSVMVQFDFSFIFWSFRNGS